MWLINTRPTIVHGHIRVEKQDELLKCSEANEHRNDHQGYKAYTGYAILSHTWDATGDEVSFADLATLDQGSSKKGYAKIRSACQQALCDGFTHIWIDTCCIDKSSSSELQEAMNSMFRWYKDSAICYVYLSGFESDCSHLRKCAAGAKMEAEAHQDYVACAEKPYRALHPKAPTEDDNSETSEQWTSRLGACRWFTRG